eukprot:CAMPEP_0119331740 /NCGR_PEP_ID=MMETSP1333-20130426/81294_1 /TAXON_ID=418940 /ORGANISM="Scyphosphaera apsteinii, Strain RCC1455" /LENGTH=625 /DNA_ID=CAMNT_0007341413 /DNA_START=54 /DNA_END=1931 /DNA_ORIENTATION=+
MNLLRKHGSVNASASATGLTQARLAAQSSSDRATDPSSSSTNPSTCSNPAKFSAASSYVNPRSCSHPRATSDCHGRDSARKSSYEPASLLVTPEPESSAESSDSDKSKNEQVLPASGVDRMSFFLEESRLAGRDSSCRNSAVARTAATPLPTSSIAEGVVIHVTNASLVSLATSRTDNSSVEKGGGVSVLAWITDRQNEPVGSVAEWPSRKGLTPMWNSAKLLGVPSDLSGRLCIELWEKLEGGVRVQLAGPAVLSLSQLPQEPTKVAMARRGCNNGVLTVQALPARLVRCKRIFLVRHGESKWNAAKRGKKLYSLVKEHDHPLNETGYRQALALQQAILSAAGDLLLDRAQHSSPSTSNRRGSVRKASIDETIPESRPMMAWNDPASYEQIRALCKAEEFWASPLTRALQTALVALEPLLSATGNVLELKANVREKKNWGGLDSIGRVCADECRERAIAELSDLDATEGGPTAAELERLKQLGVDPLEVQEAWWCDGVESESQLDARLLELMDQIRFADASSIVIVAHSHLFRAIFKRFLHPTVFHRSPELAQRLQSTSVPNGTVLDCELDFMCSPFLLKNVSEIVVPELPALPKTAECKSSHAANVAKSIVGEKQAKLKTQSA